MRQLLFEAENIRAIADKVYELKLTGDTTEIVRPGQFVNIRVIGKYLRRPISVCDWDSESLILIFKVFGEGTEILSRIKKGEKMDILSGLGNGFTVIETDKPLLVGGGVGVPPLYGLAKKLIENGLKPNVVLGFASAKDVFYKDEFESLGLKAYVATVDGTMGTKGFVTDAIKENNIECDYFYACGPNPMLKALCSELECSGQLSLEERMGCGFGACMGCSINTAKGIKRVCHDGPVFFKEDLLWK
ncbi:MAG: dihydroorotate dehydrogenase electron transfer subunit [Clostridiales bacterium]|nr:dihydroorotate dehydrogenase electron transfer subunit [Clostridiales bacterium]HOA33254.1 dihydroorotate dehydrogenase electron transfer subunit [Clostridiales bacterium]HOJ36080.1 dihydroorotate dehydrogenase electron transfer subunit [Clostridiales bacterium]HPP67491.1 dihydroorotate dehydrogenase electron transfer subunit [Clostridiales bacterium]HPU67037.1 dihydroorotate dehydrogenase electron transfer subunit [Clostridiales bacterium]